MMSQIRCLWYTQSFASLFTRRIIQNTNISTTTTQNSFFDRSNSDDLWKTVTSVSTAGMKKGRGKKTKKILDLNSGQKFGYGKHAVKFPDLTKQDIDISEFDKSDFGERNTLKVDERTFSRADLRRSNFAGRYKNPLNRGFSGNRLVGNSAGTVVDQNYQVIEDLKSVILMLRKFYTMTTLGRSNSFRVLVAVGNCKGIIGYAAETRGSMKDAIEAAKITASCNLLYFDLFENRTVFHDMDWRNGAARMTVFRKDAGYGIVSQRILAKLFYLVGIEDVYVKLQRKCQNKESLCAAFLNGMLAMDSHQKLADETGLMVVKCPSELMGYPIIISRPSTDEICSDLPICDIDRMKLEYKIPRIKTLEAKRTFPLSEMTHKMVGVYRRRNQHLAYIKRHVNLGYSDKFNAVGTKN